MTRQERKQRERAQRRQVIVNAARELAEAEGWESVTTRRLADCIEYSQPVLYSHFEGKDAIVSAVALEGFGELAAVLRDARKTAGSPRAEPRAVAGFRPIGGRTRGLIRPKMGIRRTIGVPRCTAFGSNIYSGGNLASAA